MRIAFVSHDGLRTGAPMVLLALVRWVGRSTRHAPTVLVRGGGGPLVAEFARVAPTRVVGTGPAERALGLLPALRVPDEAVAALRRRRVDAILRQLRGADVLYLNTVMNGDLAARAADVLAIPVVTHVHEQRFWMSNRVPPGELASTVRATSRYLAASRASAADLEAVAGVPPEAIEVVHEFIDLPTVDHAQRVRDRAAVRAELGLGQDRFVIGGAGTTDWRKGPDLFVQVARVARARGLRDPAFLWLGGNDPRERAQLGHDVERAGLTEVVRFLGERSDARRVFAALDLFLLPSREEPLGLVVLENAVLGTPTVCFEGAGGVLEFVERDAGVAVPYLDVEAMAHAVVELARDPGQRAALGAVAAQKVRSHHHVDTAGPRIVAVLEQLARP